jgi:hypothetical protein
MWIAENRYSWSSGDSKTLPGGRTPEDIAQSIIFKAIDGTRKSYDPNKGSLRTWLRQQADSFIDALAKSATHRHERELPEGELFSIGSADDPEDELIAKEHQEIISK